MINLYSAPNTNTYLSSGALQLAASASKLGIHVDLRWLWKLFVKRDRQLATTFNHRKSH